MNPYICRRLANALDLISSCLSIETRWIDIYIADVSRAFIASMKLFKCGRTISKKMVAERPSFQALL